MYAYPSIADALGGGTRSYSGADTELRDGKRVVEAAGGNRKDVVGCGTRSRMGAHPWDLEARTVEDERI